MTNELIDTTQIELHFEAANDAAEKSSKMVRGAVIEAIEAGEQLQRAKDGVPHGEWATYLGKHWNYSQRLATQYMLISNWQSSANLIEAKSINEALRMIADDKEEKTAPRSERKTGHVEVVEPEEPDDDPTPDPPTIRKTAKGSEKVKEADKPKTAVITPEILDDDPKEGPTDAVEAYLDVVSPVQVVRDVLTRITDDGVRVQEAKRIRKEMDKFDPPTKFTKPDLEDVSAYMHTLGDAIGRDVSTAADGFMDHYQSNGWMVGKVAMKDWRATARKWLKNQGEFSNGKGNGNGRRTTETQDPGSCLGPNGRPKVEHRKINYK